MDAAELPGAGAVTALRFTAFGLLFQLLRTLSERREQFLRSMKKGNLDWLPRYKKRCQVVRVRKDRREVVVRLGSQELTVDFEDVTFYESLLGPEGGLWPFWPGRGAGRGASMGNPRSAGKSVAGRCKSGRGP